MRRRSLASLISAGLILGASVLATTPVAASDQHHPKDHPSGHVKILLDGLSSPKGITTGPGGSVFVTQGAFGAPGPVLGLFVHGKHHSNAKDLTDPLNLMDIAVTRDGAGWAIGGDLKLYRKPLNGAITQVLDIGAYQAADPDPVNSAGEDPGESNPFSIVALKSNDVLIADAAGNDVIRVSPNGDAKTVARWSRQDVSGASAEAVPTSITIGKDGWAYVGQLVGGPGTPGSAHIWKLNPNADGAQCAVGSTGNCKDWKSGFTSIIDLAFAPHSKTLYVYEIAEGGWHAFEAGQEAGDVPPAVLLEVKNHHRHEIARGELFEPGGVAVARDGSVYVTDGIFSSGRLLLVRGHGHGFGH